MTQVYDSKSRIRYKVKLLVCADKSTNKKSNLTNYKKILCQKKSLFLPNVLSFYKKYCLAKFVCAKFVGPNLLFPIIFCVS